MIKKIFIILIIILAVILAFGFLFFKQSPDLKQYESLKNPQIKKMENQKMLVVEVKGDPNKTAGKVIGELYKIFYQLKGQNKDMKIFSLRARWPKDFSESKKEEWQGIYGVPIPNSIEKLPEGTNKDMKISVWKYGKVAEILHIGAYGEETPTIEKLQNFIKNKGYKIAGDHEEEYLKGPGMFFKGNPKKYYTIIRYQIVKK